MTEPYRGDEPYAYVSYARADKAETAEAIEHLDSLGYRLFFAQDTDEAALEAATLLIVLVTGAACDSDEVKAEVQAANKRGQDIIAIHLQEVQLSGVVGMMLAAADDVKKFRMKEDFYRQQLGKSLDPSVKREGATAPALPPEPAKVIPTKPTGVPAKKPTPAAPGSRKSPIPTTSRAPMAKVAFGKPKPLGAVDNFEALSSSTQLMYVAVVCVGLFVLIGGFIFATGGESQAPIAGTEAPKANDDSDGGKAQPTGMTPAQQDELLKESRARRAKEQAKAQELELAGNAFATGNSQLNERKFPEAIKSFTTAIGLRPDQARYHLARAKAYYGDRNDADAIDDYTKVIKLEPENLGAYLERGKARQFKDGPGAIADFTYLIAKQPKDADLLILRADVKRRNKDYKGGVEDYTSALKIERSYKAYYGRSLAKKKLGDTKGAKLDDARAQKARGL